eukprot:83872_1
MHSYVTETLRYGPLLLIVACVIFFTLDSMLIYNDQSSSNLHQSSNNMYVIINNNNDANQHQISTDSSKSNSYHPKPNRDQIKPQFDPIRRQHIINNITWSLRPENRQITLIINSCGRLDLLNQTINSFKKYYPHKKYPLFEKIIVDDCRNKTIAHELINNFYPEFQIILTGNNDFENDYTHRDERITFAMDKIYNQVTTPWIYHIEDDWIFSRKGFIDESFDIFETGISSKYQSGLNWTNKIGINGLVNKFPNNYRKPEGNQTGIDHFFYNSDTIYSVVLCWNMYRQRMWCNRTYLYEYKGSQWYNMKYHLKRGVT